MDNAYQGLGNANKSIYDYLRKPFKNLICPNVTYTLFGIVSPEVILGSSSFGEPSVKVQYFNFICCNQTFLFDKQFPLPDLNNLQLRVTCFLKQMELAGTRTNRSYRISQV